MKSEPCPKCGSTEFLKSKKLLIAKYTNREIWERRNFSGFQRVDQLAVDECKRSELAEPPLDQFVDGLFCTKCGIGFVPDAKLTRRVRASRKYYSELNKKGR